MPRRKYKQTRNRSRINKLSTPIVYQGEMCIPTHVENMQYDEDHFTIVNVSQEVNLYNEMKSNRINWIKITGISDTKYINKVCKDFGLHGYDIRDIMSNQQVVKIVVYDKVTFILLPIFIYTENNQFESYQTGFILGKSFVISIQETEHSIFDDIIEILSEDGSMVRKNESDYLLWILLNSVNSFNLNTIADIEEQLLNIEDMLIDQNTSIDLINHLRIHRVSYIKMKRSLLSTREEYNNLQRNVNGLIRDKNIIYFNDLDDKLRTTLIDLDTCHELLTSLLDLYYSNINMRMNEVMKQLTLVSTIFIPLTFMVGVWGMNFDVMPELRWKYGYIVAWIIFVIIVLLAMWLLKKKRWF